MDDLAHARALGDRLGSTFCLTYLKGLDADQALRRMGGVPGTFTDQGQDRPGLAAALHLGTWSVVIEPGGTHGADHALLEAASPGSEAVSVLRRHQGAGHFGYVVDGTTISSFDPGYPALETIWGADPGLLRPLMDALGLRPPADDADLSWQDAEARAIVLAQRITGCRLPADPLPQARLWGRLEPWFVVPAGRGDLLRADRRVPFTADLVAAARAADPARQRAVALGELTRQAAVLGLADAPGLAEALAAAGEGTGGPVAMDSPLGRQVLDWLTLTRLDPPAPVAGTPGGTGRVRRDLTEPTPARRDNGGSTSPPDTAHPRETRPDHGQPIRVKPEAAEAEPAKLADEPGADGPGASAGAGAGVEEGRSVAGLGWFLPALRGGLGADPEVAVLAALRPYLSGVPGLADERARAAVVVALRGAAE